MSGEKTVYLPNLTMSKDELEELASQLSLFDVNPYRWKRVRMSPKIKETVDNCVQIFSKKKKHLKEIEKLKHEQQNHNNRIPYLKKIVDEKVTTQQFPAPIQSLIKLQRRICENEQLLTGLTEKLKLADKAVELAISQLKSEVVDAIELITYCSWDIRKEPFFWYRLTPKAILYKFDGIYLPPVAIPILYPDLEQKSKETLIEEINDVRKEIAGLDMIRSSENEYLAEACREELEDLLDESHALRLQLADAVLAEAS